MIKSSTTTKASAVFLATVLLAGTIAISAPSFMIGTAQAQPYYGMDRYDDRKSYGMDDSYGSSDYRDDNRYNSYGSDYGMDNDRKSYDKRSYGNDDGYKSQYQSYKPDYKPAYPSYDKKDNRDKSKDSSKVDIKKIKCNNININLNTGNTTSGNGDNGSTNSGNGDNRNTNDNNFTKVKKFDKDGFTFICINNNNNEPGGGAGDGDGDGNGQVDACVNCFFANLSSTVRTAIVAELASPGAESIQGVPDLGTVVIPETIVSIAGLCAFIEDFPLSGQPDPAFEFDRAQLEFILTDLAGGMVAPGTFDELLDCLEDLGIIIA